MTACCPFGRIEIALACALGGGALSAAEVWEFDEPGRAFKEYQAFRPWIRHIEFEFSHPPGKFPAGFFRAEGAIQPKGWFLRYPKGTPYVTNMAVYGSSEEKEWMHSDARKSAIFGPAALRPGFNTSFNIWHYSAFAIVAWLGLPRAVPDDFKWTSQTEFEWSNPDKEFRGRIVAFDGNRVREVEYEVKDTSSISWELGRIEYEYDSGRDFPPSRFTAFVQFKTVARTVTNILHTIDLGEDAAAVAGYHLNDFLPSKAEIDMVRYVSNHVRYLVRPDGSLKKYKWSDEFERRSSPVRYSIVSVFLVALTITAVFIVRRRGG